jgi:1-phosphofructokinase family hexose kinase
MILTVTANTTIDQTLFIPAWEINRTIRSTRSVQSMGGKPTDASWILGEIGITSHAIGFAAGAFGIKVERMLHSRNVTTEFVEANGETRINTVIVYEKGGENNGRGQTTVTTNTLEVTDAQIAQLRALFDSWLDKASVVVIGGTLPKGMGVEHYTDFVRMARAKNVPVIFDADEPNLSAGLAGRPTFIKPNHHELEALTGEPVHDLASAYRGGRYVLKKFGSIPVITLGKDGGLVVLPERAYRIPPLPIQVVSASGAGDGVLAGLAASFERGQPIEEGLRLGFACAAAVCLMEGTADCRREDVERFLPMVELIAYP